MAVYGLALWYNTLEEAGSLSDLFSLLSRSGYGLVEIDIDYPWFARGVDVFEAIAGSAEEHGFVVGLHAPWRDIHLASPYEGVREAGVGVLVESLREAVARVVPRYIVVHVSTAQKLELPGVVDDVVEAGRRSIGELYDFVSEELPGTGLFVENLSGGPSALVDVFLRIVSPFRGRVGVCLDVGHLAVAFNRFFRRGFGGGFVDFLRGFIGRLGGVEVGVVHLHDVVFRGNREHIVLGQGDLDYKAVLKVLRSVSPRYVVVEAFRDRSRNSVSPERVVEEMGGVMAWLRVYL